MCVQRCVGVLRTLLFLPIGNHSPQGLAPLLVTNADEEHAASGSTVSRLFGVFGIQLCKNRTDVLHTWEQMPSFPC